jgi:FkbM family methyltransferase
MKALADISEGRKLLRGILRRLFPKLMLLRAISHQKWVETEESLLPLIVDPNRQSIDVGANIGRYAVKLSRLCKQVYAFEPDDELASFLEKAAPKNIKVLNRAVSACNGTLEFHVPVADGVYLTSLGTAEQLVANRFDVGFNTRTVSSCTLDDLADQDIGFIKIDIEGHEYEALLGAKRLIRNQRPKFLIEIEERHNPGNLINIQRFLVGECNYSSFFVYNNRTRALDEFSSTMQNPTALLKPIPRVAMDYVNNFFFIPSELDSAELRRKIDRFLNGQR